MPENDDISVVIPNYNRGERLLKAVESALRQTYPVREIIVCDDGSDDNSGSLIASLGEPRVRWLDCGRNGGPAIPRNKGIMAASAAWIAFLDSDDEWLPEKLALQMRHVNGYKAVCSNAWRVAEGQLPQLFYPAGGVSVIRLHDMISFNHVICSSMVVKKEALLKCRMFPADRQMTAVEDYVLWLTISANYSIAYVDQPLLNYSDEPASSIRSEWESASSQRMRIFDHIRKKRKRLFSRKDRIELYGHFKRQYKKGFWSRFDVEGWALAAGL